ncbi:MAG: VWA domain-containing protein [Sideroxydans sp.]|nr:VWA domain-containing protein [Sideroxydans sp.]
MSDGIDYRQILDCRFARVQSVFDDCLAFARRKLSRDGVMAYVEGARNIGKMGRGEEPVLMFLEEIPYLARRTGEEIIPRIVEFTRQLGRTPNAKAIAPFLQSLGAAARALESRELLEEYLQLVWQTMQRTTPRVHGIDSMYASECLPEFLSSVPRVLGQLSLHGMQNWVDYGIKAYPNDPERQRDYFLLQSADSRAILQRERHGTLFSDHERKLDLYLRALWESESVMIPYSLAFDELRKPVPYLDDNGIHLPDVYDDTSGGIRGIDRYRALLAHLMAHRRWTTPLMADNFSPFQRVSIETFEDARVEWLAMREYPGLRKLWCALHPVPREIEPEENVSYIRHRLAMLSRALLDPHHGYTAPVILKYAEQFQALMAAGNTETRAMVDLGVQFILESRQRNDSSAKVYFDDTEIDYRDDNRLMWRFFEDGDEEEYENRPRQQQTEAAEDEARLPPRLYPEWDYGTQNYRPDWVSVYEYLHPQGDAAYIEQLLLKHGALAKRLKKIIDLLKPQQKVRIRYQEEGSELDLDVAVRSLIEFRSGAQPDPRINMSHKPDGRSIAVSLLLDLSASLNDIPAGNDQSKLELSREAVSLLGWAVEQMGDAFAIGGFHSDTRHEVRFMHLKGYKEHWGHEVMGRLAAMEAGYSTRMGAAIRHAGDYLSHQQADKKLLLVLTDGEPADIDVADERLLIDDARMAVREMEQEGVYTYCINLDPSADEYVADIFGHHYTVVDNVARLPERLPQLFMALTR